MAESDKAERRPLFANEANKYLEKRSEELKRIYEEQLRQEQQEQDTNKSDQEE